MVASRLASDFEKPFVRRVLIEGNVFMHTHQTASTVDTSSAISGGRDGSSVSELMIVRNFFFDCDHMALAKEGNYYTFLHNTALSLTKSAVTFDEPGRRISDGVFPGRGAFLQGNILWRTTNNFEDVYSRSSPPPNLLLDFHHSEWSLLEGESIFSRRLHKRDKRDKC